jgi:hypothetical protein
MRHVRITIVIVAEQEVLIIVNVFLYSCFSYPAGKLYVSCVPWYYHLWSVLDFSTLTHKQHDFQKNVLEHKI